MNDWIHQNWQWLLVPVFLIASAKIVRAGLQLFGIGDPD